jgi:RNA polymerase sigma-70 factor, ECF subfamily
MAEQCGNLDIARLVAEHHAAVYRYAYRLSRSAADAEDLTQEVFLAAQQNLGQLRDPALGLSWLFTILRNRYLKNAQRRRPVVAANLKLNLDGFAEPVQEEPIDPQRLQGLLDELPEKHRFVLVMFYFDNCSYKQIADELGLPMGTVMSRIARAKAHLRARLVETELCPPGAKDSIAVPDQCRSPAPLPNACATDR